MTVGGAVALTGFFNAYDLPQNAMMEFAVEDFAAEGGRPYELVFANTNSEIDKGANAALEVLDKGADIVVTSPDYDFGRAAALEGVKAGKLVVGAAGSAKFGKQGIGDTAFNVGIATNSEGAVMAEYASEKLGLKNAYVLLDDTIEYTKKTCDHFGQRWDELGGGTAGEDIFKNADPSIATQITRLKGSDAGLRRALLVQPGRRGGRAAAAGGRRRRCRSSRRRRWTARTGSRPSRTCRTSTTSRTARCSATTPTRRSTSSSSATATRPARSRRSPPR